LKKPIILLLCIVLGATLTGCQKKTTTTTGVSSSDIPASAAMSTASAQANPADASSSGDLTSGLSSSYNTQDITNLYSQNYQEALTDANATLKNQASFCNTQIEFSPTQSVTTADIKFFFQSPAQAQWYWVGQKDNLEGKKRRFFAAKRDFDDVVCTTAITPDKVVTNFADAYSSAVSSSKISINADTVKISITFDGDNWKITQWKTDSTITSTTVSALAAVTTAQSSATSTASATAVSQ
jgi:hypothetical protein